MKISKYIINFLFPKYCLNCQKLNSWICSNCQNKIKISKTACFLCKKTNQSGEICSLCRYYQGEKSKHWLIDNLIWAADYQKKPAKKLISALKYGRVLEITNFLSLLLDKKIKSSWKDIKAQVFYVPSSLSEQKKRGFNPAHLIAQNITEKNNNLKLNNNLFIKKFKKKQTSKDIKKRWQNLNQFYTSETNLENQNIIIIDDIATSGATLNQIAKCFKPLKPKSIRAAVVFKS